MPHHTPLIGTIVAGLVVAFAMGALAHRLRISPLVGYLFAGVLIGPFTPGFVADSGLANELAELGVILLMFGVGLHFSLRDLLSVKNIAVPGAIVQIAAAIAMGALLALAMGWTLATGLVFGLALSVASTVVLLRALQGRKLVDTQQGRIAIGWLIVEDLVMVIAIVLLPVLASIMKGGAVSTGDIAYTLGEALLKVVGFVVVMLLIGKRLIPALLHWAAHSGSRELFRLAVLAVALGVAFGASFIFDVSFALGAFFAGMILGETPLSRRAAEETLPLRDAFAVLFFVSVGMLFNPHVVIEQPWPLLGTVAIILFGKSIVAFIIVRVFGHPNRTALIVSASLAQIGEFSFILASLGTGLGLIPPEARDLILGGAIISILANPVIFAVAAGSLDKARHVDAARAAAVEVEREAERREHLVVIGYGAVGRLVAAGTREAGRAIVIVEDQDDIARQAKADGYVVVVGNAADPVILEKAGIRAARKLIIAIPEGFEAGGIAEHARRLNPDLAVIARAHSDAEVRHLKAHGAHNVVLGEREIADRMLALAAQLRVG
ncbi:YbaL family putative K(+) efflux transporter [Sphingobium subterraneum]|uniref:CPA2 family monovalent cation:H+ antiporter-2 n=1 Tax=Sphingobium subterraneum TaxID=627688 RepID=A0A841IWD6_9SPHN|nr:YbaL family putative K(+) efflux transporter [Sphingobium subterraneum]MBB6122580.1 CPA2 family monovalent cation:H+ antiporter-2 [Sphingobium subterraneum]